MSQKLTIQAEINAPIEKVWKYWTEPEHITQWNQASDDWHCPAATNDLRVGGTFVSTMAAKDGTFSFDFTGTYDEVIDYQKISYTMPDGRKVETSFESKDNGVEIVTEFDPESENPLEMQQQGWQAILNSFKNYTENN